MIVQLACATVATGVFIGTGFVLAAKGFWRTALVLGLLGVAAAAAAGAAVACLEGGIR